MNVVILNDGMEHIEDKISLYSIKHEVYSDLSAIQVQKIETNAITKYTRSVPWIPRLWNEHAKYYQTIRTKKIKQNFYEML